jgi:hypothetical protein
MNIEAYITAGDEISVMPRSVKQECFHGRVLVVCDGEPGTREIIIKRNGGTLEKDGAVGVREHQAMFDVRRGDSWVCVPLLLSEAEAEAKSGRATINERKRIQQRVPLFAEQVEVRTQAASEFIERTKSAGEEKLQADHDAALKATVLRDQVQQRVTVDQYTLLLAARERYPGTGSYGGIFWQGQLDHIAKQGEPKLWTAPPPLNERLSLAWLTTDARLTWKTAPGGPQKVRVLFIGSKDVMCLLTGEPFTDYDPGLIPSRNNWVSPDELQEAVAITTIATAPTQHVSDLESHSEAA